MIEDGWLRLMEDKGLTQIHIHVTSTSQGIGSSFKISFREKFLWEGLGLRGLVWDEMIGYKVTLTFGRMSRFNEWGQELIRREGDNCHTMGILYYEPCGQVGGLGLNREG